MYPNQSYSHSNEMVQGFIQRVYQWMAAGLALTAFVALWGAHSEGVLRAMQGGLFFVVVIAELGIVIWLSSQIMKISTGAATAGFLIYSALNGLLLSFIFVVYTQASIATTLFATAGTFGVVSLVGWQTKVDMSSLRGFFLMGLIGLIIGSLINMFLQSPAFYWILTYLGIGLFIGLTAYDTQWLKRIHQERPDAPEQLAIIGALKLYLDFINLFLLLLRIFGRRR